MKKRIILFTVCFLFLYASGLFANELEEKLIRNSQAAIDSAWQNDFGNGVVWAVKGGSSGYYAMKIKYVKLMNLDIKKTSSIMRPYILKGMIAVYYATGHDYYNTAQEALKQANTVKFGPRPYGYEILYFYENGYWNMADVSGSVSQNANYGVQFAIGSHYADQKKLTLSVISVPVE